MKTSNILLSAEGVAKIADVGLAKMLTNADQYSLDHTAGTFAYAAPELILGTRCSEKVRSLCPSYSMNVFTRPTSLQISGVDRQTPSQLSSHLLFSALSG